MSNTNPVKATAVIPLLGSLGFLPFAFSAWLEAAGSQFLSIEPRLIFASYSAIILTFLGGALWGRALTFQFDIAGVGLLLASNFLALLAWVVLLWSPDSILSFLFLMSGFIVVSVLEFRNRDLLFRELPTSVRASYLRLRALLTGLVLLAHIIMMVNL